jgi:glycosyltransferase involved in cell wall biosynthesis
MYQALDVDPAPSTPAPPVLLALPVLPLTQEQLLCMEFTWQISIHANSQKLERNIKETEKVLWQSGIAVNRLQPLIEKYPGIHYLGFQENIPSYIANSNCVVLPSYREGMPRVLLEAASMQKPVIATAVAGCTNLVIPNYNGLLCQSKDVMSLASSMQVMLGMPAPALEQMGLNGRKLILEKFTSTIINQKYHSILQTIID